MPISRLTTQRYVTHHKLGTVKWEKERKLMYIYRALSFQTTCPKLRARRTSRRGLRS
jgi:hypothetical protein